MKKSFLAIIILLAMGCGSEKRPETIMDEEEMINFLIDYHIAQAGVQNLRLTSDSAAVVFAAENKYLLQKHNLADSTFLKSYNYYLKNPEELEAIYTAVVDSISLQQSLMNEQKK